MLFYLDTWVHKYSNHLTMKASFAWVNFGIWIIDAVAVVVLMATFAVKATREKRERGASMAFMVSHVASNSSWPFDFEQRDQLTQWKSKQAKWEFDGDRWGEIHLFPRKNFWSPCSTAHPRPKCALQSVKRPIPNASLPLRWPVSSSFSSLRPTCTTASSTFTGTSLGSTLTTSMTITPNTGWVIWCSRTGEMKQPPSSTFGDRRHKATPSQRTTWQLVTWVGTKRTCKRVGDKFILSMRLT